MRRRRVVEVLGLPIVIGLTACGGDPPLPLADDLDYGRLPLDHLFSPEALGDQAEHERRFQMEYELELGECLRALGFEYHERPPTPAPDDNPVDARASVVVQREWVAEHGYGLSTAVDSTTSAGEMALQLGMGVDMVVDQRNREYLQGLEPAARVAYEEAIGDPSGDGCESQALSAGRAAAAKSEPSTLSDADRQIGQAYLRQLAERSDHLEAEAEWAPCMAAKGWRFDHPADAPESIREELGALIEQVRFLDDAVDARALAELQRAEIALAVDHHACYLDEVFVRERQIEQEVQLQVLGESE